MAVRGCEVAAVVDHDEVAVARFPAAVDDRAAGGGVDRRAVADADVDPLVHAPPAPAERARDRALNRPDQPRRRRRLRRRPLSRLGGADPRGERALAACSASISSASARSAAVSVERSVSFCCFDDERSLRAPTSSSRTARVWAVRARITAVSPCTVRPELLRLLARGSDLRLGVRDLCCDRSVLRADVAQSLHVVDCVLDAA